LIVYSSTKKGFLDDVMSNDIGSIILREYKRSTGHSTGSSEVLSWVNSLQYMDRVLQDDKIPDNAGIAIEYHIPQSSKRIDFIVTGSNADRQETAVLVELKQWQEATMTEKDGVVKTRFKHGETETAHPSYQAWSYRCLLEDFNQTVQEEAIQLIPCAYLHNYEEDDVITNEFYANYTSKAPVFLKSDALKLREFIKQHVKYGDDKEVMYRIDHGKIRPSKVLSDELSSMLKGNQEFVMIDDQKVAYETALSLAMKSQQDGKKRILIIEGGPRTGKSVLAINLLVELTKRTMLTQYVTRNSAPREVYQAKLTGSLTKSRIANLFRSSGSFTTQESNSFDVLIVDEAHRLNEKSGLFQNQGENQIKEIINASKFSVFFVDEDQKVTLKDIGDKDEIHFWGMHHKAETTQLSLESQFRCNGSDGYIAWLDNMLQIRNTANESLDTNDYDFRIFDDPRELFEAIKEKNKVNNKSRLLAGYCWNWISANNPELKDIVIGDFEATWNLKSQGQSWIIQPNSVEQVGCIHTTQGLELEYVGVIIGPDITYTNGEVITRPEFRATSDKSISGWRKLMEKDPETTRVRLDSIIKNTYRTLMTRGQKGCYVYFIDKDVEAYIKKRLTMVA
jgi:DUF2075 family protein